MQTKDDECGVETRHFHVRPDVRRKAVWGFAVPWAAVTLILCLIGTAPYGWPSFAYYGVFWGALPLGFFVWQLHGRRPLISIGENAISIYLAYSYPEVSSFRSLRFLWTELEKRHELENGVLVLYPLSRFGRTGKLSVPIDKLAVEDQKAVVELVETYLAVEERIDCLACGEPIEPALRHCPKCGWTWS